MKNTDMHKFARKRSFTETGSLPKKGKIALTLAVSLFLLAAIPLSFAAANPDSLLHNVVATIQDNFQTSNSPDTLSAEAGVEALETNGQRVVQVATGDYHTLVIREDGTLWAWGGASGNDGSVQSSLGQVSGRHGQLGLGDNYQRHIPTQVGTDNDWHYVAAGGTYSLAIKTDGTLWAWGNNVFGQLGLGDTVNRNIPVQVGTDSDWQNIFLGLWSSYAIKSDGTLWSWGNNSSNQLGLGSSTENRNVPTQVGTDSNWQSGSAHMLHALAMRDDGTLWAWGGRDRPLGVPQISTNRFTPTQVVPGSTWLEVSTHSGHTLAIRDDGTLWAWGNNLHGRLGIDGLSVTNSPPGNATLPTQVGSDNNWQSIAAGGIHSIAIRDDGTLWAWGNGHAGALGIPRPNPGQGNDPVPTPVQVRDETNWESIFAGHQFSTAIRSDGNIWVTGQNRGGQLAKAVSSNWYVIGAPDGYGRQDQRFWRLSASLAPSAWNIWSNADNAVTPNHTQLDVEMDIDTLTVRFDRPMRTDAASLGTITLDNGASVDLSQATWSSGTHVGIVLGDNEIPDSVLTVPLELTASGTVHTATISGFIDAQFGLRGVNEMHPHTWTFRTESILEVTDEFPAGDSVAVNTPSLVITFSEAVNHTAGTRMITNSGGEYMHVIPVPADAGIWNAERTVLTLPIPEGFLEYATQYTVNISGFTAVAGGTLASHQHTFTTESASLADTFSVMEVLPTGNRVAIDVESLVITFSASVNPTAGTPSVTIVGGELDHSFDVASAVVPVSEPGAWNAERTVLTLAMPEELEYATQYTVDITGFVSVEDAELIDYTHNFRTVSEPLEGLFTKTLELPEGTTVPSPTFSFNFAPYQVVLDDSVTPNISSRPTADFATLLTNQNISLSAADAVTIDGVTTIAGALDIASILSNLSFPGGGVYVWNVSEVAGSSSTTTPSYMSYDDTLFQIRAWVNRDGELEYIAVHNIERDEVGTIVDLGKTEDGINFFNTYMRQTGSEENPALEVTKEVTGNMADLSTLFNFTLTLDGHSLAPITNTPPATLPTTHFTARIVDEQGTVVDRVITITPGANNTYTLSFQLRDGERLEIPTLPAGTGFVTSEAASSDFSPSATVTLGGVQLEADYEEGVNTALTTGNHIMRDTGRNAADFTNDHFSSPHTGLVITNNAPIAIIVGLALLLVVSFTLRNRRRIEQMPLYY